jgi:hypothetical protein
LPPPPPPPFRSEWARFPLWRCLRLANAGSPSPETIPVTASTSPTAPETPRSRIVRRDDASPMTLTRASKR